MESKVYQKGQIVIPAALRKKYNIEVGGTVDIIPSKNHLKIIPLKQKNSILDIAGCFKSKKPFPGKKQVEEAVRKGYSKDADR